MGASGNPAVPGMRFYFATNERWPYPNPTGLPGMMEAYCPPRLSGTREAVDAAQAYRAVFMQNLPYDPLQDFIPIAPLTSQAYVLGRRQILQYHRRQRPSQAS